VHLVKKSIIYNHLNINRVFRIELQKLVQKIFGILFILFLKN
jgi:hypothetical protein